MRPAQAFAPVLVAYAERYRWHQQHCAAVVGAIGRTTKVDHLTPVGHRPDSVVSQQLWMQPDQQPYLGVPVDSPGSHLVVTML